MGVGKLYRYNNNQFLASVNYKLLTHPAATNWWGELTLIENVRLSENDRFIIELEDKRKSKCFLKKRVNRAVIGTPARFIYHVTGLSPLV